MLVIRSMNAARVGYPPQRHAGQPKLCFNLASQHSIRKESS